MVRGSVRVTRRKRLQNTRNGRLHGSVRRSGKAIGRAPVRAIGRAKVPTRKLRSGQTVYAASGGRGGLTSRVEVGRLKVRRQRGR